MICAAAAGLLTQGSWLRGFTGCTVATSAKVTSASTVTVLW
jgi:hypothetical protein